MLQALEPIKPSAAPALVPSRNDLAQLLELGDVLVKSKLLPQSVTTKEAAAIIILKGMELGIPAMAAMEGIAVVKGKAAVGSHLLLALVKRAYGPAAMWVSDSTNQRCTVSYRIPGLNQTLSYTYTMEDAATAKLASGETWQKYPAAMLRARAISAAAKLAFPEVVGGLYVAGELPGTTEAVGEDGEVVISVSEIAANAATGEIIDGGDRRRVVSGSSALTQTANPNAAETPAALANAAGMTILQHERIKDLARELGLNASAIRKLKADNGFPERGTTEAQADAFIAILENLRADDADVDADAGDSVIDAEFTEQLIGGASGQAGADRWTDS